MELGQQPVLDIIQYDSDRKFVVVRDDLLGFGAKARYINRLILEYPDKKEWVFGGSNKVGWGPISLAYVCRLYNKKCTLFYAKRNEPTWHQKKAMEYGANIIWVNMGMLGVTLSRAKKYVEENIDDRITLPLGLEHPIVLEEIGRIMDEIYPRIGFHPSEFWTVGSSGTLNRGIQNSNSFRNIPANVVQTGHTMNEREIGRAKLYISPYKFDKEIKPEDAPPYPSEIFYDAKVWPFVCKYALDKALIYNVA